MPVGDKKRSDHSRRNPHQAARACRSACKHSHLLPIRSSALTQCRLATSHAFGARRSSRSSRQRCADLHSARSNRAPALRTWGHTLSEVPERLGLLTHRFLSGVLAMFCIGFNDALDHRQAHNVRTGEVHKLHAGNIGQCLDGLDQARANIALEIDLSGISRDRAS